MTEVQIHLVRHGEVDNPKGILYGRLPGFALSERGHDMAERLGKHFSQAAVPVRAVWASPLLRTQQTAEPIALECGRDILTEPRIIEAENYFTGRHITISEIFTSRMICRVYNPYQPSWGEPYWNQVLRMRAAMFSFRIHLQKQAEAEGLEAIAGVMVSHQLPIWVTRLAAENKCLVHDPRKRECSLASATTFFFSNSQLRHVHYEDICHDIQPAVAVPGA